MVLFPTYLILKLAHTGATSCPSFYYFILLNKKKKEYKIIFSVPLYFKGLYGFDKGK